MAVLLAPPFPPRLLHRLNRGGGVKKILRGPSQSCAVEFAFDRTASRIIEMGSTAYLRRARNARSKRVGDVLIKAEDDVDVDALFAAADVDGSGKLDEVEFTALLEELSEKTRGHRNVSRLEFELARGSLDANRDGLIDLNELREEFYHRKLRDASDRLFLDRSGELVAGAPA